MRTSSLRQKLALIVVSTAMAGAFLATAVQAVRDLSTFWKTTSSEVSAVGAIVADQAAAAVLLQDKTAAREILNSLHADNRISDAFIFSNDGVCFQHFHRRSNSVCPNKPPDGTHLEPGALVQSRAILAEGERVGTLTLRVDVPTLPALLQRSWAVALSIIGLNLMIAFVLVWALEAKVSAPILAIATVARRIAESHHFDERVGQLSNDEVGILGRSLNLMLEEIERRDSALDKHRRELEAEIAERSRVNIELLEAKRKAEEAARLKTEFLANMSHELRTPMNGVIGMLSLVLDTCGDPDQREQLQTARTAAESLTSIVNDILDLSKIEAGKMLLEEIAFDFRCTVREVLRMFDLAIREKTLACTLDISPQCPPCIHGDPVRLRQILINLVGNAVKFTKTGGVAIRAFLASPELLRFEVEDTGIGIPQEKMGLIFEAFTQADGSHTRQFGGTGLGLAITLRLVKLMKGQMWAESEPGKGSRFIVELPIQRCSTPVNLEQGETPVATQNIPSSRVLVAEDNVINQKVICAMLRRAGCTVALATNGQEAIDMFFEEPFDLVLMDVQMPVVDGLEAAARIRKEERQRGRAGTRIIALTAHAADAQQQQCLAAGMDGVITKPINRSALLAVLSAGAGKPGKEIVTV